MSTTSEADLTADSPLRVDASRMGIVIEGNLPFEIQGSFVRSRANGARIVSLKEKYSLLRPPYHLAGERVERAALNAARAFQSFPLCHTTLSYGLLTLILDQLEEAGIHTDVNAPIWHEDKFQNLLNRGPIEGFIAENNTGEIVLCGELKLEQVLQEIIDQAPDIRIAIVTSTTEQALNVSQRLEGVHFIQNSRTIDHEHPSMRVMVASAKTFDSYQLQRFIEEVDLFLVVSPVKSCKYDNDRHSTDNGLDS